MDFKKYVFAFVKVIFANFLFLFVVFQNNFIVREDGNAALSSYTQLGEAIATSPEREGSEAAKFEKDLVKRTKMASKIEASQESRFDSSTSFCAIAAPSMTGKTQLAFHLRKVKPLYFCLSTARSNPQDMTQQAIYSNFSGLSNELLDCAFADCSRLRKDEVQLSATGLRASSLPSLTLGFLAKLVQESRDTPLDKEWMRFHSTRPGFRYEAMSIAEGLKFDFKGYVLVLDEFTSMDEFNFIRNLARTVGLVCIVTSTNSKAANIVGTKTASATTAYSIWSHVITKLDPAFRSVLNHEFDLHESIGKLVAGRPENDAVVVFLRHFVEKQLLHLRPGIANFVAEIFKSYANTLSPGPADFTLGHFVQYVCLELWKKMCGRKTELSEEKAMLGHIALLFPYAYSPSAPAAPQGSEPILTINVPEHELDAFIALLQGIDDDVNDEVLQLLAPYFNLQEVKFKAEDCNDAKFIDSHLFHLKNPVDQNSTSFDTFPSGEKGVLNVYKNAQFTPWPQALSEFDPLEFLTLASCQFFRFPCSSSLLLKKSIASLASDGRAVAQSPNPLARSLDGNTFEVSSAVSLIKASHYLKTFDENNVPSPFNQVSFKGKSAFEFIQNLVYEKSYNSVYLKLDASLSLKNWLNEITIPFLYSIGSKNEVFEMLAKYPDLDMFIGNYQRTSNASQVDGIFDAKRGNSVVKVCCECKNRAKIIYSNELLKILLKTAKHGAELTLVFCTAFVSDPKVTGKLYLHCWDKDIQVYRVVVSDGTHGGGAYLDPFFGAAPMSASPASVCILLESYRIDGAF